MAAVPRLNVDPTKITGPFPLIGLFLLVVEGVLVFWIFKATSGWERGAAGLLMTALLVVFLLVVAPRIWPTSRDGSGAVNAPGIQGTVTVAVTEATPTEVAKPEEESIPAPDGSYLVARPPEDWRVSKLTQTEWALENLQVTNPNVLQLPKQDNQPKDVLVLQSPRAFSVMPVAGKSIVDGRKIPTALEVRVLTRVSILPLERAQPPFFIERTFEHNFWNLVSAVMRPGVLTLRDASEGMTQSQRPKREAVFNQSLENVIIEGDSGRSIDITMVIIGIEGYVRDHALIMSYPSLVGAPDLALEQDKQTLKQIVGSFRPLKVVDPEEQKKDYEKRAQKQYRKMLTEKGDDFFEAEFGQFLMRIADWNLDDPEKLVRVIQQLKAFHAFAEFVKYEDDSEDDDDLWTALHKAELGDAADLKELLREGLREAL